ncbi:hypothetical protein QCA50_006633 [Cerrena zonata]|uniref:MFS general substrate transporter n=1 Tax=Cerrena zonata TaxID=2478898 RepID=A0AAW0G9G9_9APHY
MPSSEYHPPPVFSTVRIVSLLSSLLVALASGTNYVFSAYGPQLGARLHLSHTQLNVIGLSGNIGVYGTAPLWGKLVDAKGPRILLVIGFVFLLSGYLGIRHLYDVGLPEGVADLSTVAFGALVLCGFMTGIGGNGGLASSMNVTAKSWPDRARATTTGLVLSGFGLSAFLFSTLAHIFYPGDTSEFLLLLAIGTSFPMVWGFFFVRHIPLPHSELTHSALEHGHARSESATRILARENNSTTHLLKDNDDVTHEDEDEADGAMSASVEFYPRSATHHHQAEASDYVVPRSPGAVALSPTRSSGNRNRSRGSFSVSRSRSRVRGVGIGIGADGLPNMRGMALAVNRNFWLLFTITSLLSGTGIMYINNVGSISQALYAEHSVEYDEVESAQLQALQVSTISIMNCVGRIGIGIIADITKNYFKLPRSFCISLVASLFVISQVAVYNVEHVNNLWKASALLGVAYGSLFGLFPTITIEWFGLPHFSENWGFVSLSPMIGGNIFSIAFGRNLDAHAPSDSAAAPSSSSTSSIVSTATAAITSTVISSSTLTTRGGLPSDHQCLQGRICYADSLKMTIFACCFALLLALYAGWIDRHSVKGHGRALLPESESETEVLWEEEEE